MVTLNQGDETVMTRTPMPSPLGTNKMGLYLGPNFFKGPCQLALDAAPRRLARDQHEDLKELAARKAAPPVHNITKDVLQRIAEAGILKDWEYQGLVDALFPKEEGATDQNGDWKDNIERLLRARGLGDDDVQKFWKLVGKDTLPEPATRGGMGGALAGRRSDMGMDAATVEREFFRDFPGAARIVPEAPRREERRSAYDSSSVVDEMEAMGFQVSRIGLM
jgi:hypothetical protein